MNGENLRKIIKILKMHQITLNLLQYAKLLEKFERRLRRWWVKPHILPPIRNTLGSYAIVCQYFQLNDHEEFKSQLRMSVDDFQNLYDLVGYSLQKQCITMRAPILPAIRLSLNLQ